MSCCSDDCGCHSGGDGDGDNDVHGSGDYGVCSDGDGDNDVGGGGDEDGVSGGCNGVGYRYGFHCIVAVTFK